MEIITESQRRLYQKLYADLGEKIVNLLKDKTINEVLLNPDGSLWSDSSVSGLKHIGQMSSHQAFAILHDVAGIHNYVVSYKEPQLEAELPFYQELQGQRFTGQVPPIVSAPSFTIRKRSEMIFSLDDYVSTQRMTLMQANVLEELVKERKNILVCGGPGSGKTTVTNVLIKKAAEVDSNQRFLILEDTPELQCSALNKVEMVTSDTVNMTSLLKAAMRMRPDRILIGEVRGAEALDMLKAWNTGCPGGICTVHANGCEEAVQRICDLAMEAGLKSPPISLVKHTIDAIVSVGRNGHQKGFIQDVVKIAGFKNQQFIFEKIGAL